MSKRLLAGAAALTALGALDEQVAALQLDLENAAPGESGDAASLRQRQLAECSRLAEALGEARKAQAAAELKQQTGR